MSNEKPGRPLGLSLAIILSVGLYCLLPLLQLGVRLYIQDRMSRVDSPVIFEGEEYRALASGGTFQISPNELAVQGGAVLLFFVVAVLAWRGGRPWIRGLFTGTVLLYGGLTAFVTLRGLLTPPDPTQGVSSIDTLIQQGLCGVLVTTVLIPLYVLWYINRAPARAFYRGRYLSADDSSREP